MQVAARRARSHAHGLRHGRALVHAVVVGLAAVSVISAAAYSQSNERPTLPLVPAFAFSGVSGMADVRAGAAYLRPGTSHQTLASLPLAPQRVEVLSVRASAGISPVSSFSTGVNAAAATSGEAGAGVRPLADVIDPQKPFVLYVTLPGDTVSGVASRYNVSTATLLSNNPTVKDGNLIQLGQEIIIPRKEGILYKVGHGDSVASIVKQFDEITETTVMDYRPNAITDPKSLETGRYVLLPGAKRKPPPPPPPPPPAARPGLSPGAGAGGTGPRAATGQFGFPLANWRGISDQFGSPRGGGSIHEGIDLDLYGLRSSPIYSACEGVVSRTEFLTYSYGYHVIVDCGGGWTTLYAHMSQIGVSPGQRVSKGSPLGVSGVTGYTTGEHLHFEIRYNGAPVNPANYIGF